MRHYVRHLAGTLAVLCAVQCSTVLPVWAEEILLKQGTHIPEVMTSGDTVRIQGEITASGRIRQVTAGIYELDGTAVCEVSAAPFAEVYQLARLSDALSFDTLSEGEYLYQVTVTEMNGHKTVADSQSFVIAEAAAADIVYCTEENRFPSFLHQGEHFQLQGTVCSPTPITSLTAVISEPDGTPVSAVVLNAEGTSCSLERLHDELEIEKLQPGRYILLVMLENGDPLPHILINHSFSVEIGAVPPKHTAPPETTSTTVSTDTSKQETTVTMTNPPFPGIRETTSGTVVTTIATTSTETTTTMTNPPFPGTLPSSGTSTSVTTETTTETTMQLKEDTMTIVNAVKIPESLSPGDAVIVRGIVQSAGSPLENVTVEIYDAVGTRMSGKSVSPGVLSYDLNELDRYIMFNTLPAGSYLYRVTASNAVLKDVILDIQNFTVGTAAVCSIALTNGMTIPVNLSQGSAVIVRGTVQSTSAITSLTVGVYDSSGMMVTGRMVQPNAAEYDLNQLDAYITFNTLAPGEYTYRVVGTNADSAGQLIEEQHFTVTAPAGLTYINGILVVNKSYSVPASYNPGGLLSEVQTAFNEMAAAARMDGISLRVYSGFRSYARQTTIYNNYCAVYGQAAADTFSARPGHSEHQTGMAIDVNCADDSFIGTKEAKWLAENSWKYGFIIRYPEGKQHITGFKYEPWHVRYLGRVNAGLVYQSGLTLEEYLGIDSVYH